jgi:hypothetical protein
LQHHAWTQSNPYSAIALCCKVWPASHDGFQLLLLLLLLLPQLHSQQIQGVARVALPACNKAAAQLCHCSGMQCVQRSRHWCCQEIRQVLDKQSCPSCKLTHWPYRHFHTSTAFQQPCNPCLQGLQCYASGTPSFLQHLMLGSTSWSV